MKKNIQSNIFFEVQNYYFVFESMLIFFFKWSYSQRCFVVQFNVEKHNVVSTLFYVVNFSVDKHNVVSTLIWRCTTSPPHFNLKTTLNRRWNVCWVVLRLALVHSTYTGSKEIVVIKIRRWIILPLLTFPTID